MACACVYSTHKFELEKKLADVSSYANLIWAAFQSNGWVDSEMPEQVMCHAWILYMYCNILVVYVSNQSESEPVTEIM